MNFRGERADAIVSQTTRPRKETCIRSNNDSVSLLEMPALKGLIASTPAVERAAGEALFRSGEPGTSLPLVISGNARIFAGGKAGRQLAVYRLKPGDICPISLSALLQRSTYPVTATAETTVQVRYLSGEKLHATISSTPEIFSAFLEALNACLYNSVCTTRQLMSDPRSPSGRRICCASSSATGDHQ